MFYNSYIIDRDILFSVKKVSELILLMVLNFWFSFIPVTTLGEMIQTVLSLLK